MANGDRVHRVDSERPKRVTCHRCRLYDRELRRCRLGKVNPRSKLDTYEAAQVLGVRALCAFNLYREQLLDSVSIPHSVLSSFSTRRDR